MFSAINSPQNFSKAPEYGNMLHKLQPGISSAFCVLSLSVADFFINLRLFLW